jgi:HEAT repeat protein
MDQQDSVEPTRNMAGHDGDFDDLPDVPDAPDDGAGADLATPMGSDDDAVRQIRRRVSPMGWFVILSVLVIGGGVGYYMYNSAVIEAREEREREEGRLDLSRILQQNLSAEQTASQVRAVYGRYQSENVRMAARRILAGVKDPQSVPMLIDGLALEGVGRAQAALGLAEIGLPAAEAAKPRLLDALPRTDPQRDRVEVAWALVVLNEPRAWPTVRELLESGRLQTVTGLNQRRIFDPALVARMAGKERLVELVSSRNSASKRLAALSLSELATPDLVDPLTVLSRDSDVDVAREAAIGLGRTGDPRASDAIMAFLSAHPDLRDGVLGALATSAGASGLSVVIRGARDLQTRATATRLLREQKDPDSGDAFVEAIRVATETDEVSQGMRRNAVFGLAEIGDVRAVDGLVQYATYGTTHTDSNATQDARQALEQLRRIPGASERAKAALIGLLRDPHGDFARTPAMLALATAGDPSVASVVTPFLSQPDAQEGAAVALCALRNPTCFNRVVTQVKQPAGLRMADETVRDEPVFISRRNAIRGLAWAAWTRPTSGDTPAAPSAGLSAQQRAPLVRELRKVVEDATDRRALREEAGFALASIGDEATISDLATRATDTSVAEDTRLYYIYALRGRSTPAVANRLVQTYLRRGTNPDVMKAAAITAGFGADDSTSDLLIPLLALNDGQDANVRFSAAMAVALGGNARAANALVDALIASDDLAGTLQNEFVPRSSSAAATAQENWALLPITAAMFADGRIHRRVETAMILEAGRAGKHFGFALTQLTNRLRSGWDSAMGIGPHEIRATLRASTMGTDAFRRDQAFRALRSLNDRGSLLALRRQTRSTEAAERARRELLEMSSTGTGG